MRIVRYRRGDDHGFGILEGETVAAISPDPFTAFEYTGEQLPAAEVRLSHDHGVGVGETVVLAVPLHGCLAREIHSPLSAGSGKAADSDRRARQFPLDGHVAPRDERTGMKEGPACRTA